MDILSQQITLVLIGSAFFILVAVGIIVLFLVYQKKQLQMLIQKQQLENQFRQELLNTRLEVQEHTLNQVSQEIHDNIGQVLSLVKLNLNKVLEDQIDNPEIIKTTKDLVQRAIADLRMLSKTLNSEYLGKRLLSESLKHDLALIEQSGVCKTKIHLTGNESDIDEQRKLVIYRMGQELLNNAIKHSNATLIQIYLSFTDKEFQMRVEDNGIGIKPKNPNRDTAGTGIENLNLRAKLIGGKFSISNGDVEGTKASLLLPL